MKQSYGGRGLSTEGDRSLDDATPADWTALNVREGRFWRDTDDARCNLIDDVVLLSTAKALSEAGSTQREIADSLRVSLATVNRLLKKARNGSDAEHVNERGGEHYRKLDPQPWDVTLSWEAQGAIGHALATVIEYIARHQFKVDPAGDIDKAIHWLQKYRDALR